MKRFKLIFFLGILLGGFSSIHAQSIDWQQNLGGSNEDKALTISETADGGFIVGGISKSSDQDFNQNYGGYDIWVVKYDSTKEIEWKKQYGGSDEDRIEQIIQTSNGNYVFYGHTASNDEDVSNTNGGQDLWVVKIDQSGQIIWENTYGGSNQETSAFHNAIHETSDQGFIFAGSSLSNDDDVSGNYGGYDFWVVKLNSNGTIDWEQNYGGSGRDMARQIRPTQDGGYFIMGESNSNDRDFSISANGNSMGMVKINEQGAIQWSRTRGRNPEVAGKDFIQTAEGGFLLFGHKNVNQSKISTLTIKVDNQGNFQWNNNQNEYGGSSDDYVQRVFKRSPNRFHMVFRAQSDDGKVSGNNGGQDLWFVTIDSLGRIIREQNYGGTQFDRGNEVMVNNDGNVIIAGGSGSDDVDVESNNGNIDMWLVELTDFRSSKTLNKEFCKSYKLPGTNKNYTEPGTYKDTFQNQLGYDSVITLNLSRIVDTSVIKSDDVLQAVQPNVNYQWGRCEGGFQPIAGAINQVFEPDSSGQYALVVNKDQCRDTSSCYDVEITTGISNANNNLKVALYPNPVNDWLNLTIGNVNQDVELKLIDVQGKVHRNWESQDEKELSVNLSGLENGVYFLELEISGKTYRRKVIKQ